MTLLNMVYGQKRDHRIIIAGAPINLTFHKIFSTHTVLTCSVVEVVVKEDAKANKIPKNCPILQESAEKLVFYRNKLIDCKLIGCICGRDWNVYCHDSAVAICCWMCTRSAIRH